MNKILMISQSNYDLDPRIIRYTDTLRQQNIAVDIICLRYNDQKAVEFVNGTQVYRIMKSFSHDYIISYAIFSFIFILKAFLKSLLLSKLKNRKYDLIHVHNMPDHIVFAASYFKLKSIPIILDIHDLTVELFKEKWSKKKFNLLKPVLILIEKLSCDFADHLITVTQPCVDILIHRGIKPEKISLIMNTADERIFTYSDSRFLNKDNHKYRFLYLGTLAKRFGVHHFINAMPDIIKSEPNSEFHIFSEFKSDYAKSLKSMVEKLKLTNNVIFKNTIPYKDVNEILRLYDLGVVTYEQTQYMNLAIPTKALEFAANGLPFVISSLDAVKTIFKDENVCYINPGDPVQLAKTTIRLLHDLQRRTIMSKSAYESFKSINWSKMQNKYLHLINQLTKTNVIKY